MLSVLRCASSCLTPFHSLLVLERRLPHHEAKLQTPQPGRLIPDGWEAWKLPQRNMLQVEPRLPCQTTARQQPDCSLMQPVAGGWGGTREQSPPFCDVGGLSAHHHPPSSASLGAQETAKGRASRIGLLGRPKDMLAPVLWLKSHLGVSACGKATHLPGRD